MYNTEDKDSLNSQDMQIIKNYKNIFLRTYKKCQTQENRKNPKETENLETITERYGKLIEKL